MFTRRFSKRKYELPKTELSIKASPAETFIQINNTNAFRSKTSNNRRLENAFDVTRFFVLWQVAKGLRSR